MQFFNALTCFVAELAGFHHTWSETPKTGYHAKILKAPEMISNKRKKQSQQNHRLRTAIICKYWVNLLKLNGISHSFQFDQIVSVLRDCCVVFLIKRTFCKPNCAVSNLGPHFLHMSHRKDAMLICVQFKLDKSSPNKQHNFTKLNVPFHCQILIHSFTHLKSHYPYQGSQQLSLRGNDQQ